MSMHARMLVLASVLAAMLTVLMGAGEARGQYAPAGNAHPEHAAPEEADLPNPFGEPAPARMSPSEKHAFAAKVDLAPLRDLAVFHNGRVKIVDTLARETVSAIVGRRNYFDVVPGPDGKPTKLAYDPVFTLVDLAVDPLYYYDLPLVHVEYLPLREAILERAVSDPAEYQRWKKIGRVSPHMLADHGSSLREKHAFEDEWRRAFSRLASAMGLYRFGHENLLVVAPDATHEAWWHLSQLPAGDPKREAALALGAAWRAGDAEGVNRAIAVLAEALPAVNPEMYPGSRRWLEALYNRASPFEWGYWLYFLSLVSLLLSFGTGRVWLRRLGVGLLLGAVLLHAGGFAARCILAERLAIQNQYESMTGVSLLAALVGCGLALGRRQLIFGAAAAAVGFLVLITATQTGIPGVSIEREAAILNTSVLLKYHVTTVLASYGLISLGMIISLFYLGVHYTARRGAQAGDVDVALATADSLNLPGQASAGRARILKELDTAQMTVLQLAFWTLGVGILLGAWWADHSWGRWWAFDPKETWALITWIVYLVAIHTRFTGVRDKGLITSWLSVIGFIVMLWCYFGVNLLLPGLHAYA